MSRLGDLRNDNDPNSTYEGDNNVLLQQSSNYLLDCLRRQRGPERCRLSAGAPVQSPLGSVDFLEDLRSTLQSRFTQTSVEQCLDPAGRSTAQPSLPGPSATLKPCAVLSGRAVAVATYRWLVCFLLEKSQKRLEQLRAEGQDQFQARNNSQVAPSGGPRRGEHHQAG